MAHFAQDDKQDDGGFFVSAIFSLKAAKEKVLSVLEDHEKYNDFEGVLFPKIEFWIPRDKLVTMSASDAMKNPDDAVIGLSEVRRRAVNELLAEKKIGVALKRSPAKDNAVTVKYFSLKNLKKFEEEEKIRNKIFTGTKDNCEIVYNPFDSIEPWSDNDRRLIEMFWRQQNQGIEK